MSAAADVRITWVALGLFLAGCATTPPAPTRVRVTLDASGVRSGPHFDTVVLLANDPVAVPRAVGELFEGTESDVVFDLHDAPGACEGRPFEVSYGRRAGGGPYRVAGWGAQLFPRDRPVTQEVEVTPDCVHLFVAVSPIGGGRGGVFGPFAVDGGGAPTVHLTRRSGEFDASAGAP